MKFFPSEINFKDNKLIIREKSILLKKELQKVNQSYF